MLIKSLRLPGVSGMTWLWGVGLALRDLYQEKIAWRESKELPWCDFSDIDLEELLS